MQYVLSTGTGTRGPRGLHVDYTCIAILQWPILWHIANTYCTIVGTRVRPTIVGTRVRIDVYVPCTQVYCNKNIHPVIIRYYFYYYQLLIPVACYQVWYYGHTGTSIAIPGHIMYTCTYTCTLHVLECRSMHTIAYATGSNISNNGLEPCHFVFNYHHPNWILMS